MRGLDKTSAVSLYAAGGFVFTGALMVGWGMLPLLPALKEDPDYLCSFTDTYSPVSPVPFEGLVAPTGEVSWFPIGIHCEYWAGEGLAAVTNDIDWLATQVAIAGLAFMVTSPAVLLWFYLKWTR